MYNIYIVIDSIPTLAGKRSNKKQAVKLASIIRRNGDSLNANLKTAFVEVKDDNNEVIYMKSFTEKSINK